MDDGVPILVEVFKHVHKKKQQKKIGDRVDKNKLH